MSTFQDELLFKQKYLKYKNKYLDLKVQDGGLFDKAKSSVLVFNKKNCQVLMDAINKYRTDLLKAEKEEAEGQKQSITDKMLGKNKKTAVEDKTKVSIKARDYNGNPTLFKYTLGSKSIDPIFYVNYTMNNNKKDPEENKQLALKIKELNKSIDIQVQKYKAISTLKLDVKQHAPFVERMNTINCDTLNLKGNKTIHKIIKYVYNNKVSLDTVDAKKYSKDSSNRFDVLMEFVKDEGIEKSIEKLTKLDKDDSDNYPRFLHDFIKPETIKKEDFSFIIIKGFAQNPKTGELTFTIESINEIISENFPASPTSSPTAPIVTTTEAPPENPAPAE
jgi:hypothetical protein